MEDFRRYRISAKRSLSDIKPSDKPFARGSKQDQKQRLAELAVELDDLQNTLYAGANRKVLLVLQGLDTSGKDGTIRWVFSRTSPLGVRVNAFKAPNERELAHDFLWRCHAVVPANGELCVWNRSHYEDVLVPAAEGWLPQRAIERRYEHINNFERLLTDTGTVIVKCMLHISRDEQRGRLQERLDDPGKNWKFDPSDLATRAKWDIYQQAYEKALAATSTSYAPWYVIPANSKRHRNLMVAQLLVQTMRNMDLRLPPAKPSLKGVVVE